MVATARRAWRTRASDGGRWRGRWVGRVRRANSCTTSDLPLSLVSKASTWVQALGGSISHAPSAPPGRVWLEGATVALGPQQLACPSPLTPTATASSRSKQNANYAPSTTALSGGGRGGCCGIPWGSNPGAGHLNTRDIGQYWCSSGHGVAKAYQLSRLVITGHDDEWYPI